MVGADTKTAAPARRGMLARLARKPTAQRVVCRRCGMDGGGLTVESEESDGSSFHPAHFTLTVEEAEAAITIFENAQRHDIVIESSWMRATPDERSNGVEVHRLKTAIEHPHLRRHRRAACRHRRTRPPPPLPGRARRAAAAPRDPAPDGGSAAIRVAGRPLSSTARAGVRAGQ